MNRGSLIVFLLITTSFLPQRQAMIDFWHKLFLTEHSEDPSAHIPIQRDESGFYVLVNVFSHDNKDKDTIKLLLAPYSSITLLVGQCLNFNPYDCKKYRCDQYLNGTISYSFPYFIAEGYYIKADIGLGRWNLKAEALLSTRCIKSDIPSYGNGFSGILSPGIGGNAWANFESKDPALSLLFFPDGTGGELGFSKDSRRIRSGSNPIILHADNSWHVQYIQGMKLGKHLISNLAKMIFDPNEETIGFSLKMYRNLLSQFNKGPVPIKCNNHGQKDFYRPNCTYHGELKNLPNMTILAGREKLIIPPEQYVKNPETFNSTIGHLTLNIRAIYDVVHTPENHVTTDYKVYIIIGHCVMKNYYMVFNGTNYPRNNNTIELYPPNYDEPDEKSFNILWIIIPISIIFVSFIICGVFYIKKRRERQHINENRLLAQSEEDHRHPVSNEIQNGNAAVMSQNNNEESGVVQRNAQLYNVTFSSIPNQPQSGNFMS